MASRPVVILLGGAPGTGKTTVANLLVRQLDLVHHLSTGFIRASIRHLLPEAQARALQRDSYDAWRELPNPSDGGVSTLLQGVAHQATIIGPSIRTCVERALEEGIGLVVEGTQLVPGVLDAGEFGATLFCVLDVPDRKALRQRVVSRSHDLRKLSEGQLTSLLQLQEELVAQAHAHGVPVVVNDHLPDTVREIERLTGRSA